MLGRLAGDDRSDDAGVSGLGRAARRALADARYDVDYYGAGPTVGRGYADLRRGTSNADALAVAWWTWLDVDAAVDVGCAAGFFVQALGELGIDARGFDLSDAAFARADPATRARLGVADVRDGLPLTDGEVPLVCAAETLEHLAPADVPEAIAELARVSSAWVAATIPSFGPNASGPDGWLEGKVTPGALARLTGPDGPPEGPVARADLARDDRGLPVEGHLTIAPYRWWTERFADAGLRRVGSLELQINVDLARYGQREFVCCYLFAHDGVEIPRRPVRSAEEVAAAERRLGLRDHDAPPHHVTQALADLAAVGLAPRQGAGPRARPD